MQTGGGERESLTLLRFGLRGLGVAGGHTDRRFEQRDGSRVPRQIQRAEAAPDYSGCRERPEIRGAGGGSGPSGCCRSVGPLCFGRSRGGG